MLNGPPAAFTHHSDPPRTAGGFASTLHSLQPSMGQVAFQGTESVLADSGREGELTRQSGAGKQSGHFGYSLRECSPVVPPVRTFEGLAYQHCMSAAC